MVRPSLSFHRQRSQYFPGRYYRDWLHCGHLQERLRLLHLLQELLFRQKTLHTIPMNLHSGLQCTYYRGGYTKYFGEGIAVCLRHLER